MRVRAARYLLLLLVPAAAAVADGPYLNALGGVALVPGFNDTPHKFLETLEQTELTEGRIDWKSDVGFVASGALGYQFGPVRADGEFAYLSASFTFPHADGDAAAQRDDTFTALALLGNFWFDLDTGSFVAPYFGLGVGATNLSVKLTTDMDQWFDGTGWGFAFQAGAGVAFQVVPGFSLDLGYRFFGSLETSIFHKGDLDLSSVSPSVMAHRIQLGVRFPT